MSRGSSYQGDNWDYHHSFILAFLYIYIILSFSCMSYFFHLSAFFPFLLSFFFTFNCWCLFLQSWGWKPESLAWWARAVSPSLYPSPEAFRVFCFFFLSFLLFIITVVCAGCVYVGVCGGQRPAFGSWFSLLGTAAAGVLTCWVIVLTLFEITVISLPDCIRKFKYYLVKNYWKKIVLLAKYFSFYSY